MAIEIRHQGEWNCPVFVCDWCRQVITGDGIGVYTFTNEQGPVTILHKGSCDDRYGERHGRHTRWERLDRLPAFLQKNLNFPEPAVRGEVRG